MATTTTGRFVWHELHTNDRIKAQKFYTQLMGWETKEVPMGPGEPYTLCLLNGKDFAGITKSMAPQNVPPHCLTYLAVEHVDSAATKAKEIAGKIIRPPTDIPYVCRFAAVTDHHDPTCTLYVDSKAYLL